MPLLAARSWLTEGGQPLDRRLDVPAAPDERARCTHLPVTREEAGLSMGSLDVPVTRAAAGLRGGVRELVALPRVGADSGVQVHVVPAVLMLEGAAFRRFGREARRNGDTTRREVERRVLQLEPVEADPERPSRRGADPGARHSPAACGRNGPVRDFPGPEG